MRKFFPNMETAIIFVFLICVGLWGVSRCKKKRDEASLRTATETSVSPLDTLVSPAATRARGGAVRSTPTALPPASPQYQPTAGPLPQVPTNSPMVPQVNTVPQSYSNAPTHTRVMPMPSASTRVVTTDDEVATTAAPSNTMLYVLINGLNIRVKPDLKAKSKGRLKINEQVYFLQDVTEQAQSVRLADGTTVSKPWFKIQTKRGTIGWVHGSGVDFYKRKPNDGL